MGTFSVVHLISTQCVVYSHDFANNVGCFLRVIVDNSTGTVLRRSRVGKKSYVLVTFAVWRRLLVRGRSGSILITPYM